LEKEDRESRAAPAPQEQKADDTIEAASEQKEETEVASEDDESTAVGAPAAGKPSPVDDKEDDDFGAGLL
jgi:hypothetical protein